MGGLTTLDAVYVAIAFIVPGFVFSLARNQFIAGQDRHGNDQYVRYLCHSALNYAVFGWLIYLAFATNARPFTMAALWTLVILIGPAALGVLSGFASQKDWFRRCFQKLGMNPVHVVPTAWDFKFGRMAGEWVMVTLKDGTRFAGFCGGGSFASTDPKERDLFLQSVFDVDDNNSWLETRKSLFIAHGEIRSIEFWPVEQEKTYEQAALDTAVQAAGSDRTARLSAATANGLDPLQSAGWTCSHDGAVNTREPAQSG